MFEQTCGRNKAKKQAEQLSQASGSQRNKRKEKSNVTAAKHNCNSDVFESFTCSWNITAVVKSLQTHNKSMLAAVCAAEVFTQRYCRWNSDTEIKLISVTLMWQQTIHDSIRSHFHSTTHRQRIPWSRAANGSLYQPLWKACLITHSSTTVPRVVDFPPRTLVHRAETHCTACEWRLNARCICYWEL